MTTAEKGKKPTLHATKNAQYSNDALNMQMILVAEVYQPVTFGAAFLRVPVPLFNMPDAYMLLPTRTLSLFEQSWLSLAEVILVHSFLSR